MLVQPSTPARSAGNRTLSGEAEPNTRSPRRRLATPSYVECDARLNAETVVEPARCAARRHQVLEACARRAAAPKLGQHAAVQHRRPIVDIARRSQAVFVRTGEVQVGHQAFGQQRRGHAPATQGRDHGQPVLAQRHQRLPKRPRLARVEDANPGLVPQRRLECLDRLPRGHDHHAQRRLVEEQALVERQPAAFGHYNLHRVPRQPA